jgi:hypothetical protein
MQTHRSKAYTGDSACTTQHVQVRRSVRNLFLLVLYYIFIMPIMLFVLSNNTEEADFDWPSEN